MEQINRKQTAIRRQLSAILCVLVLWVQHALFAQAVTLVDFGASAAANRFDLAGWNSLLLSPHMAYSAAGPAGVVLRSSFDEYSDYMGVRGGTRTFSPGERIVVTWHNDSDQPISFTSRISFTDSDRPDGGASSGSWFTMRRFEDYRYTYTTISPFGTARTVFNITDSGVHKCDGVHSLININLHIEWFETWPKQYLICDRIELMSDADITPPDAPSGLTAAALSDSKIELRWQAPGDDVGVVEYLIYLDGEVEGYTRETHYTAVFLEAGKTYAFTVSALDRCKNESARSAPVSCATLSYRQPGTVIHPSGLAYRGAFKLPEVFSWGGEAVAYHPNGDGGRSGGGADDGYAGSLFVTDVNQREHGFVGEVSIPAPVVSGNKDFTALPEARLLKNPVDIRPANINAWGDYVDIWRTGLTYVAEENRLYSVWSVHYTVTGEKHACISCCNAAGLAGSKYGAWYIGHPAQPPIDAMVGDYLFTAPQPWAAANTSGRYLLTGRCRDGGLSGLGPTLYALAPVAISPPTADSALPFTTLLQYGSVEGTDYYHFADAVDGYRLSDSWKDAAWLSAGEQNGIVIMGNKARGEHWYGYMGERMAHEWVLADVPYPEFYETDPDGKGWKSHNFIPMAIFFAPEHLARVAQNVVPSSQPQPYAAKRFDAQLFFSAAGEIRSLSYDADSRRLYAIEFVHERDGLLIVHVWEVNETASSVDMPAVILPEGFTLRQNYPNPFNAVTVIGYVLPVEERVTMAIYDLSGKKIKTLWDERRPAGAYEEKLQMANLPSGVYLYRLQSGSYGVTKKMVLVR